MNENAIPKDKIVLPPLGKEKAVVDDKQGVMIPIAKRCNFRCRRRSTWLFADLDGNIMFLCDVHRDKYTDYGKRK